MVLEVEDTLQALAVWLPENTAGRSADKKDIGQHSIACLARIHPYEAINAKCIIIRYIVDDII